MDINDEKDKIVEEAKKISNEITNFINNLDKKSEIKDLVINIIILTEMVYSTSLSATVCILNKDVRKKVIDQSIETIRHNCMQNLEMLEKMGAI